MMHPSIFQIDDHDLIWAFTIPQEGSHESLKALLEKPIEFIRSHSKLATVPFADGPITILFQYTLPVPEFFVHGVQYTNLISVRCPIQLTDPSLTNPSGPFLQVKDPTVISLRLDDPKLGYAHFDPTAEDDTGVYDNIANIIAAPTRLPEWLNEQTPDPNPQRIAPDGKASTDDKKMHFKLSSRFRYLYQTYDPSDENKPKDGETVQCTKVSGGYTPDDPTDEDYTVEIDEARQVRWYTSVIPPVLMPA